MDPSPVPDFLIRRVSVTTLESGGMRQREASLALWSGLSSLQAKVIPWSHTVDRSYQIRFKPPRPASALAVTLPH